MAKIIGECQECGVLTSYEPNPEWAGIEVILCADCCAALWDNPS